MVSVVRDRELFVAVNKLFSSVVALVLQRLPKEPGTLALLLQVIRVDRFYDIGGVSVRGHTSLITLIAQGARGGAVHPAQEQLCHYQRAVAVDAKRVFRTAY